MQKGGDAAVGMATDFLFTLENRPGTGARVLSALGQAGINILGASAVAGGETVHVAVDDGDAVRTRQVLQELGVTIRREHEVLVVPIEDRPGTGGALLQRLADAGVNVEFLYLATTTRMFLGVEDAARARQALSLEE